ncbi:MAG: cytochrome c3 family protein [Rhodospirillales bacterium]
MSFVFRYKMQRTRGEGYVERDEPIDETVVTVGRGTDCQLYLNDPRVLLEHVVLERRDGRVYARPADAEEIRVDSQSVAGVELKAGSILEIGPYELRYLGENDDGVPLIEVELVTPLSDAEAELRERTRVGIDRIGLSVRGWAWAAVLVVLVLGGVLPLSAYFTGTESRETASTSGMAATPKADRFWSPGPLSRGHAAFNDSCSHCHVEAFERVKNTACLSCHQTLTAHADPAVAPALALDAQPCTACHTEHVGGDFPLKAQMARTQCTDCHENLKPVAAQTTTTSVASFAAHPEFRATGPFQGQPGRLARLPRLDEPGGRVDGSGLKFPHKKHLDPKGVRQPDGSKRVMTCSSCHTQDGVTGTIRTSSFEQQCQSCHVLAFSPEAPHKTLPHGDTAAAKTMIEDHFHAIALRGYDTGLFENMSESRRLPGEPLSAEERETAITWAENRASQTLAGPLGKGLCASCHVLEDGASPDDWSVAAINPPRIWFPHARFNHDPHVITECTTCHAAPASETGQDLLLPSVATCRTCHTDEPAPGKVVSACRDCHDFHGFSMTGRQAAAE